MNMYPKFTFALVAAKVLTDFGHDDTIDTSSLWFTITTAEKYTQDSQC